MKQSLVKSSVLLSVSSLIFMISAYLINIILGRYLGPADYGVYGIIISLMTVVNLIQSSGLPQSVSKFIAEYENKSESILKSGLYLQIISTLIITLIYFLLSKPIALLLNDVSLTPYIQISSLVFPIYGIYSLYNGYYNGLHDFKKQTVLNITYSIAKAIFVLFLAFLYSLSGAICGFIIAPFISLVKGIRLPSRFVSFFPFRTLIVFAMPLIGFAFLSILMQSIDLYFVKALLSSDIETGYYTANQNIAKIPFFAFNALSLVLFPSISRGIKNQQPEQIKSMINKSIRFTLVLLVPGILISAASSDLLIELIYSSIYLPAAPSLSILLVSSGFFTVFTIHANILNGAGMPKSTMKISAVGVIAIIIFCILLIPKYGLVGAALASTIGCFITLVFTSILVYNRFKTNIAIKSLVKILIASIPSLTIAYLITIPPLYLPIFYVFLFILYLILLIVIKELTKKDFESFKAILPFHLFKK